MLITKKILDGAPDNGFNLKYSEIAGTPVVLITPRQNDVKWTKRNLVFRSSLWAIGEHNIELISAGFPKFFNMGEHPEITPDPTDADLLGSQLLEKIDGSLLIVSSYRGKVIHRTRGTFDASELENGHEIALLKERYPAVFNFAYNTSTSPMSFLYEWYSPNNRIVLDYGDEPKLFLVGVVRHNDYSLAGQNLLDDLAKNFGVLRPKYYNFNSLDETIKTVKAFSGVEGICIYYNNGQDIKKLKGDDYLAKHALRSQINEKFLLDFFMAHVDKIYDFKSFQKLADFDFENLKVARPIIDKILHANSMLSSLLYLLREDVAEIKNKLSTRKEQALEIQKNYKQPTIGVAFTFLDGRDISDETYRKLLEFTMEINNE